tara:strand:- start:202 stop:420 length:219 start_codon:yes stop_codon:yes gene_type:complete
MGISIWQIVLVLVIIVILFGAGKIPRVMGDIAKGIKSFKAGMKEGEEADEIENETPAKRKKNNSKNKKASTK